MSVSRNGYRLWTRWRLGQWDLFNGHRLFEVSYQEKEVAVVATKATLLVSPRLACRLKILMAGLPEQECELARKVPERHNFLFSEVAVVVVDFQQDRLARCAGPLHRGDEFPRLPGGHTRIVPSGNADLRRILHGSEFGRIDRSIRTEFGAQGVRYTHVADRRREQIGPFGDGAADE